MGIPHLIDSNDAGVRETLRAEVGLGVAAARLVSVEACAQHRA